MISTSSSPPPREPLSSLKLNNPNEGRIPVASRIQSLIENSNPISSYQNQGRIPVASRTLNQTGNIPTRVDPEDFQQRKFSLSNESSVVVNQKNEILVDSDLSNLRHLQIRSCPKLKSLPQGLSSAKSLEELSIKDCQKLTKLPEKFPFQNLKKFEILNCPSFQLNFEFLSWLPKDCEIHIQLESN